MASPETLLASVRKVPVEVQTLMIVGHNPGLEQFVEILASKGDPEARRLLSVKYPTAGIAVIDFPFDSWSEVEPGSGRLDRFATPKSLGIGEE